MTILQAAELIRKHTGCEIKISKNEVLSFFGVYRDSLPLFPTEAKLRHLLIKPTPSDSIKKETVALLNTIKTKINMGESFEEFAKNFSKGYAHF